MIVDKNDRLRFEQFGSSRNSALSFLLEEPVQNVRAGRVVQVNRFQNLNSTVFNGFFFRESYPNVMIE